MADWMTDWYEKRLDQLILTGAMRKIVRAFGERPRRDNQAMIAQAKALLCDKTRLLERWQALLPDERRDYLQLLAFLYANKYPTAPPSILEEELLTLFHGSRLPILESLKERYFLIPGRGKTFYPITALCPQALPLPLEPGEDSPPPPPPFFARIAALLALVAEGALYLIVTGERSPDTLPLPPHSIARLQAEHLELFPTLFLLYHLLAQEVITIDEPLGLLQLEGERLAAYLAQPEGKRLRTALRHLDEYLPPPDSWSSGIIITEIPEQPGGVDDFEPEEGVEWGIPFTTLWHLLSWLAIFSDGPFVPLHTILQGMFNPAYVKMLLPLLELLGMAEHREVEGVLHARFHHLQQYLWGQQPPAPFPVARAEVRMHQTEIEIPIAASSVLHREAQRWGTFRGIEGKQCRYHLDAERLDALLVKGESADDLAARWEASGTPVPPALRRWWEARERRYGRVRLYTHVDWLSARDALALREIEMTVPEMEAWSAGKITPTDLLLRPGRAEVLMKALQAHGYMPNEEA